MDQTFYALLLQHHHANITNDEQSEFLFKLFMQVLEFKNECVDHDTPDRFWELCKSISIPVTLAASHPEK